MAKKKQHIIFATGILLMAYSCKEEPKLAQAKAAPAVHTFSVNGSVREMVITPETPDFPEHEGKSEFMSYCAVCHSLNYVSAQPNFPRETWRKEVEKMVVKYGAPIDSATGEKITNYLVAIKGTGE
jgi:mono/diheme cytochrome c family protein